MNNNNCWRTFYYIRLKDKNQIKIKENQPTNAVYNNHHIYYKEVGLWIKEKENRSFITFSDNNINS